MLDRKSLSWFYPKSAGDPGRDRNARTLQFSCFLLAFAIGAVAILNVIGQGPQETPLLVFAAAGLVAAAVMNRAGRSDWAARTAFLAVLLTAVLLVFEARDGFRSHAMLVFPGLLLISVMLLDRASYVTTAGIVLVAVAALGIAVKQGLTRATPPVHTSYASIFFVDLNLLVIAIIGSRIARDTQRNVFDLRANIDRLSAANLELVQIREHLQESEQRLKSAQRLTHVGSWHWNLRANQVVCSEECKYIFGQPEDYAPSLEGLLQIITPRDRARVANEIQRGVAEKSGCSTEFRIVRPNGNLRTVTLTSQVLLDEEGSPRHIFGACQDVTDDRRTQEEAVARKKLETVGTLANGIAHDFNNLLGSVLTSAELALAEVAEGASPAESLHRIRDVAERGAEIVRQLMIYAGQESPVCEFVDVSRLVDEMIRLLKISTSKQVIIKTALGTALPVVAANPAQIRQVIMNLVINASEAIGDAAGVIEIVTSKVVIGSTSESMGSERLPKGNYLRLTVSDTGCGMTAAEQARVFDPFFTTKTAGHGLGLAVVQGIVRALGGAIGLASTPSGTTFEILLPCVDEAARENAGPDGAAAAGEDGRDKVALVLVIEDEESLRTGVSKLLRTAGLSVMEADDGASGLDLLRRRQHEVSAILLDVTLPGMSSPEILRQARQLRPDLKVILTSAYSEEHVTVLFAGAKFDGFLRKPYRLADLTAALR